MGRRVLFRADAEPSIGTGDLLSLIQLSAYFSTLGWESFFLIRGYHAGLRLVETRGVKNVTVISENAGLAKEVEKINRVIRDQRIDLLFTEITARPLTGYDGLDKTVIKACDNFDGRVPDNFSLIVNWDVEAPRFYDRSKYPETRFLLGPEYVILPSTFSSVIMEQRSYQAKPETLLVAMGGGDELDFTGKVARTLITQGNDLKTIFIVGSGYPYLERLKELLAEAPYPYTIEVNISDMLSRYLSADVAIGAGGLTSSELVATGTPSLLVATYEHQVARCREFHRRGWSCYLGFRSYDEDELMAGILTPPKPPRGFPFRTEAIVEAADDLFK